MDKTANGLSYPVLGSGEAPNGPAAFEALAKDVDARYGLTVANFAALAGISTPFKNMTVTLDDTKELAVYNGSTWDTFHPGKVIQRIGGSTVGSVASSAAGAETIGGSQAFTVISGKLYRANFSAIMSAAGATPSVATARLRMSTGAVGTGSTQIGQDGKTYLAAAGGTGQNSLSFFAEFTAGSSGVLNIAVGVAGSGATTYTAVSPSVVLDRCS